MWLSWYSLPQEHYSKEEDSSRRNLCSQAELVWPPAQVKLLLGECLLRKNKVQQETIPVATWKEISKALKECGANVSWEICRGKYVSLNEYFSGRLLYTGGVVSGVKVPYYDILCKIHDVPADYVMPMEVEETPSSTIKKWERPAVMLLLSLYKARMPLFTSTKSPVRHSTLYREIAAAMVSFKIAVTGKQCGAKFKELKETYNKEYDDCHKTGAPPSSWDYYRDMDELFGETAGMKAPFIVSLGTTSNYQVDGKECHQDQASASGTRTRTSSQNDSKKPEKKKAPSTGRTTFRSRAVAASEVRVQQQDRLLDQMQNWEKTFSTQCETQNQLLKLLIEKASNNNKQS